MRLRHHDRLIEEQGIGLARHDLVNAGHDLTVHHLPGVLVDHGPAAPAVRRPAVLFVVHQRVAHAKSPWGET